jgi:uncharacterized tellurite resistance protein B-like protein
LGEELPRKSKREIQAVAEEAQKSVGEIMAKLAKVDGYASLTPSQKSFLLASLLGTVVPADYKVKDVELDRLKSHLSTKFHLPKPMLDQALEAARKGLSDEHLDHASKSLVELLSMEDRINLVGLLWDVALCDLHLAPEEEVLVNQIAELAKVSPRHVKEQKLRVARAGHA